MTTPDDDLMDRAAAAALALTAERSWREVSLRDIAAKAGIGLPELYRRAPAKRRVIDWLSRRLDLAALKADEGEGEAQAHDRLFEAVMRRVEAMEPHRAALLTVHDVEGPGPLALRLPATARAMLEGAGIDASGKRGLARIAAMTAAWARVLQVWRADQGALNRTMAEIDRRLKQMRETLNRVGAGF